MRGLYAILLGGSPNLVLTWVVIEPNDTPRYVIDIIELGSLYSLKTYLIQHLATEIVLIKFMGIIYCIFIKRSITTIIFINLLLLGKSTIKSIEILRHLYIGIGNG